MRCHYWYLKDVGYKCEPHVCNECHDALMVMKILVNPLHLISSNIDGFIEEKNWK